MEQILFLFVALVAITGAVYFVFARNPLYAILSLIVVMFSIAGLYIFIECAVPRDCTNHCLCRSDHGPISLHLNDVESE